MERRNFIKNTLVATGAFAFSSAGEKLFAGNAPVTSPPFPATTRFKKSVMWGTVGLEGSVLDKCKVIKEAGYNGIEPNSHMDRNEVSAAMKSTGLIASSVCCSTHWENPLSHPDASVRRKGLDGMIVALEDAKAYGTDAVLLVPGVVNETVRYDECWSRSVEGIRQLLPVAEKLDVKICIENVWNNFLLSPMEACNYVDQFNSDYVRFYFDCSNILVYGWPEQWIRILGKRIGRIHIKEFSKQEADKQGRWAGFNVKLTEGDVDWKSVMEEAHKSYNSEWLTTEQGNSQTSADLKDLSKRFDKILAM
jgi:hexulose-6-phosphate isomerase